MQQVYFCSGSTFVTGDRIAVSLLRYVQTVAATRTSDVVTIPTLTLARTTGAVMLMLNAVSQISADTYAHDGPELEDDALVARLELLTHELSAPRVWHGEEHSSAA